MRAPTGHVRDVQDLGSGKYFTLVGPEGAISWRLMNDSRRGPWGAAIWSHLPADVRGWMHGPDKCDLIGECYGDGWYLGGDRALEALQRDPAELWTLLEECYTDMVLHAYDEDEAEA